LNPRPNKYRFYLDENFPAPAGKFLKSKGHNVLQVVDMPEFRAKSDLTQIKNATKSGRILVALDRDFKSNNSLKNSTEKSNGVLLIVSADPSSEKVISILKKALKDNQLNNLDGKLCRASINEIKIIEQE